MAKSMLGDYQSPDEPDNIIKDRELTIDMSFSPSVGIHEVKSEKTDTDEWYTLQGVRLEGKPTHHGMYIHNGRVQSITSSQP